MLIMVGASATGKTEIAKLLINKFDFKKMITYTTRPKRENEVNGVDYHFVTVKEFKEKEQNHDFFETTLYNNNYYGTAFKDCANDKVLIVDANGANAIYSKLPNEVTIFYLHAPYEIREQRMIARGDNPNLIEQRLVNDDRLLNINLLKHYDYVIESGYKSLDELALEIYSLYQAKQK